MFNRDAPPGFRGFDPEGEVQFYLRHLPHWRQDGATYFVTFRLADSLPQSKLRELRLLREQWHRQHPPPVSKSALEDFAKKQLTKVERWLDQGMGSCCLRDERAQSIVADSMTHFNDDRYQLGCFVVMPNHVHCVVKPLAPKDHGLEDILHSWKRYTAREINKLLGNTGTLWQDESFDRIVRDEEHLYRVIGYIGRNPIKAGLSPEQYRLWICEQWIESGWGFASCEA